ncbi:sigma-54-dependent Fis family transcriptional regulator [Ammoniphilus resinae]|uniref:Transcriptional regulator with PAS, ATPase and Fis domain n=1 Tax=Ammoniphilus resinae TaxID=861532 RepID=A0ABS4GUI4_9BACL|nr:sigma-54-dependent Fis family transcriptional regulator [Ammoniphilus resinae]MBP1933909.1 transcriptional regulator with PAS, ATPase and Fis domain [Ammoniphilus resinae]
MDCKIAVLGYKNFIELARDLFKDINQNVTIDFYETLLEENLEHLPKLEKNGTDIIISGRANKALMASKTHIPVIAFEITLIDILSAIKKSIPISKHIAIVLANFEELEYDLSILQDLLDIELNFIAYETKNDLQEKLQPFTKTEGVVIGTSIAMNIADEFGLKSILVYSENSVLRSIERALEIIHFKREEEQQHQKFKAIIHSVSDGIIATNDRNEITIINDSAWNLLRNPKEKSAIHKLSDFLPAQTLQELTTDEYNFQDKMIKLEKTTLNTNRTSILVKGKKAGNVFTFQDITKIKKIEQKYRLENEGKGLVAKNHFADMIGSSPLMKQIIVRAKRFAGTDSTILITGETGTGKEILAQSIHNFSNRKSFPFVAINCAALPETLLESELFGYEDGAFTGAAKKGKKGLFELAHNGTVFLDEINSVSLHFQARLLRVVQEREIVRIGGGRVIPIDVRIIAASNQDLMKLVASNAFRADLFYRLNLLKINLPPLRNRKEDIIPLARQFILGRNKELYHFIEPYFESLFHGLLDYSFPGNIRELFNILERFVILCDLDHGNTFEYYKDLVSECMDDYSELLIHHEEKIEFPLKDNYKDSLMEAERSMIRKYMQMVGGDKTVLSEKLGMGRTTLYRKLKELNIN